MGKPIPPDVQDKIAKLPHVRCVTDDHVVLKNGSVLDPEEFDVTETPAVLVLKLHLCHCGRHEYGLHILVLGYDATTATGERRFTHTWERAEEVCPGWWTCEEVIEQHDPRFKVLSEQALPPL